MSIPFDDLNSDPVIHGYLHVPARPTGKAVVLTHGAGADCQSKLLVEMSNALAESGFTVLRFDLPFRRERPHGPPSPSSAARDRDGLRRAVSIMREQKNTQVFLGGHSYGGRQGTMLASEEPELADGLLLLSYPLHPPRKPNQLRTGHFPKLASNIQQLIIARSVQGVGAAFLVPGSLSIISVCFDEKTRGQAIGTWSGFTAMTTAFGPVLGGWLIEHASWRWASIFRSPLQ